MHLLHWLLQFPYGVFHYPWEHCFCGTSPWCHEYCLAITSLQILSNAFVPLTETNIFTPNFTYGSAFSIMKMKIALMALMAFCLTTKCMPIIYRFNPGYWVHPLSAIRGQSKTPSLSSVPCSCRNRGSWHSEPGPSLSLQSTLEKNKTEEANKLFCVYVGTRTHSTVLNSTVCFHFRRWFFSLQRINLSVVGLSQWSFATQRQLFYKV